MEKYEIIQIVGQGAYGIVYKCVNKQTKEIVAIKKFKELEEEVRHTMIRELSCLQKINHENIVGFIESFILNNILYIVFEYVEKNLLEVLEESPNGLDPSLIKKYVYQMCKAVNYLHKRNIIHRDIKPENLLINTETQQLKLCDFGFARDIPFSKDDKMTDYVATRWYRSPELLITGGYYGIEVDYWAIGCIMGELVDGQPLFPGENELDQIHHIQNVLGNLPEDQVNAFATNPIYENKSLHDIKDKVTIERIYKGKFDDVAIDFMKGLLELDPSKRLCGDKVYEHPYFREYDLCEFVEENERIKQQFVPLNNINNDSINNEIINEISNEDNRYEDSENVNKSSMNSIKYNTSVKTFNKSKLPSEANVNQNKNKADVTIFSYATTYKQYKKKLPPVNKKSKNTHSQNKITSHKMRQSHSINYPSNINHNHHLSNESSPSKISYFSSSERTHNSKQQETIAKTKKSNTYIHDPNNNNNIQTYRKIKNPKTVSNYRDQIPINSNFIPHNKVVQLRSIRVKETQNSKNNINPNATQIYFPSITNNKFYLSKNKLTIPNITNKKRGIKFTDVPNLPKIYTMNQNSFYFSNLMAYINMISN